MKIAIYHNIMWSKYKGGVFSQVHAQATERRIPVEFIQIAETEGNRSVLSGVDMSYHRYPFTLLFKGAYSTPSTWSRVRKLLADLRERRPDFVIIPGYDRPEYWAMLAYCVTTRIKRAVFCDSTMADRPRGGLKEIAKKRFFSMCDGVFCYGTRSMQYLMHYGVPKAKIFFRVQAAALPHAYSERDVLDSYRNTVTDPSAPRYLFVGRISPEKGLKDLLAAMALVLREAPGARLSIVGAGPQLDELKADAMAKGVSGAVDFLGSKDGDQLAAIYREHDAFVLPSHSEPWGLVVNEALAYGCPVVVSDACGCVPELVRDGRNGYSFPVGDAPALAKAMLGSVNMKIGREGVAADCLASIRDYSPQRTASQILSGCLAMEQGLPAQ